MRPKRILAAIAFAVVVPSGVQADPVEVRDESERSKDFAACSTWVEPAGEEYEWTSLCGYANDLDGDGAIDQRGGIVIRETCEDDGSAGGSWCSTWDEVAQADLPDEEFVFDIEAGVAFLRADLGDCDVDVAWNATGPLVASDDSGASNPSYWIDPPAIYVFYAERDARIEQREAAIGGDVCALAGVSGDPAWGHLVTYEVTRNSTTIAIDPTA